MVVYFVNRKFTNYVMKSGRKVLARELVKKTFEEIKRIQVEKYNSAPLEERENIETDVKKVFYQAVENSSPTMRLRSIRKGGIVYQVIVESP